MLARLMESQIWHLPLWLSEGRVQKRNNGLCLQESCSPAFALMPDTSVSPCMPLVPFKLLPRCWSSEGVSLIKSVCEFFKGNCLGLLKFLLLTRPLQVFAARSIVDSTSWHWNLGLGHLVWAWDSSFLRYPSRIFIHYTWM